MSDRRLRWISLVALGVALVLALRHTTSPKAAMPPPPAEIPAMLTVPVEIVEAGREPRRLDVKIPAVDLPAPLR